MRCAVGLSLALAALAVAAPGASAAHNGAPRVDHHVADDGGGRLIANPGGHLVTWERCEPGGGACSPHGDGDAEGQNVLVVDEEQGGATFRATQDGVTVSSDAWKGRVRSTSAPRVEGDVRVGGFVRPVAGTWQGGWGREADWLQLQACTTAEATDCVTIVDELLAPCEPGGGRRLPARYEGRWLAVADHRSSEPLVVPAIAYGAPEGVKPWRASPGTAHAVIGRIAPGTPPPSDCGSPPPAPSSPPMVTPLPPPVLAPTALLRGVVRPAADGRLRAAQVTCPGRCVARLSVRQGRRRAGVRRALRPGTTWLALPRTQARRLRAGGVEVAVAVDGRRIGARRAVLRVR